MSKQIKRLMSLSLSFDYTTERFKMSLGGPNDVPLLRARNSFQRRRIWRILALIVIGILGVVHLFPDILPVWTSGRDKIMQAKLKAQRKDVDADAFAKAKWASDQVQVCSQRVRKQRIERLCEKRVKEGKNICGMWSLNNIMVDDKHKGNSKVFKETQAEIEVLYCEVPKAACTSWKMFFAEQLGNITDEIRPVLHHKVHRTEVYDKLGFKFLGSFSPEEQLYRIQHYWKFMTVRNPLARVVSAYENKLERQHPDSYWYQEHVGTYIVKNYRENPAADSIKRGHDVTFDEFTRFIGNKSDSFFQRWDRHWSKQFYTCCPCMIKYDYISKIETLAEDSRHIIDRILGPGNNVRLPRTNVMNLQKESLRVQKPFRTVKNDTLENLLIHYITDLNMYGYGIDQDRKIFCNSGGDGEDACC